MTKETQTQAIAEPFKFKNAALLNRLSEMAQVPYYATACHTLIQAEMAIVELERENATLRAEVERLAAQAAPSSAIIASLCGDVKPVAYMFEFPDKRVAPKFDSAPHGGNWQKLYPASTVAALKARATDWQRLYDRAINEANGLTNYVEDRPELRSAERRLDVIAADARALKGQP